MASRKALPAALRRHVKTPAQMARMGKGGSKVAAKKASKSTKKQQ
jgi:hypothetical protein